MMSIMKKSPHREAYSEFREISPSEAADMLQGAAPNRSLSHHSIDRYAMDIQRGSWQLNGESIKFDHTGSLIDGQHRLHAIIKAGKPVKMLCVYNIAPEAMRTVDTGRHRTNADALTILGEKNTTVLAGAIKILYLYKLFGFEDAPEGRQYLSADDAIDVLCDNEPLRDSVNNFGINLNLRKICNGSSISVAHYLINKKYPREATEFFRGIAEGTELTKRDPRFVLREKFMRFRMDQVRVSQMEYCKYLIKAFNLYRKGKQCQVLVLGDKEEYAI